MKILITGGAGFIGSHVANALLNEGHEVAVLDDLSRGKQDYVPKQARFYHADITSTRVAHIIEDERPEVLIHNAAHISVAHSIGDPVHDAHTNIIGTLNILEQTRRYGVKKFIYASSGGAIYGQADIIPTPETYPGTKLFSWSTSPYCISKFTAESYLMYYQHVHGIPFVSLRFANVYGPRQDAHGEGGVVGIFTTKMLKGEIPTIYGNGSQTRDFVYVNDVVYAYLKALQNGSTGFFNVSTGIETSINTLYTYLAKILNISNSPVYGPTRAGDVSNSCLDNARIKQELGWTPRVSLEQGLQKTVAWLQWFYKMNH
jgi:UDP-glucose 4-epimerase